MERMLFIETPVGPVTITATGEAVTQIRFGTTVPEGSAAVPETAATPLLLKAAAQLREYFAGTRREFTSARTRRNALPAGRLAGPANDPYGETSHLRTYRGADRHNKSFRR